MSFGWDLPPGVTDSMCEPNDPACARCGHLFSMHYDDEDIEYSSDGDIRACDHTNGRGSDEERLALRCLCEGFEDGEYCPNEDDYGDDL